MLAGFGFWWELSSWLIDSCLLAVFSHGLSSTCAPGEGTCSLVSPLIKTLILLDQGHTLMTSFNLNSFQAPTPSTTRLGVSVPTQKFEGPGMNVYTITFTTVALAPEPGREPSM